MGFETESREHSDFASQQHFKQEADTEEEKQEQRKQSKITDAVVQREYKKQGESIIYNFIRTLIYV